MIPLRCYTLPKLGDMASDLCYCDRMKGAVCHTKCEQLIQLLLEKRIDHSKSTKYK